MRKQTVTIFPDGTYPTGGHTAVHKAARMPGAKRVERNIGGQFCVSVFIPEQDAHARAETEQLCRVESEVAKEQRIHLDLADEYRKKLERSDADLAREARDSFRRLAQIHEEWAREAT